MPKTYPNSGALFINDKRSSDRSPAMTGNIEFDMDMVKWMANNIGSNGLVKIQLSAWKKVSQSGKEFMSISAQTPFNPDSAALAAAKADNDKTDNGQSKERSLDLGDDIPF